MHTSADSFSLLWWPFVLASPAFLWPRGVGWGLGGRGCNPKTEGPQRSLKRGGCTRSRFGSIQFGSLKRGGADKYPIWERGAAQGLESDRSNSGPWKGGLYKVPNRIDPVWAPGERGDAQGWRGVWVGVWGRGSTEPHPRRPPRPKEGGRSENGGAQEENTKKKTCALRGPLFPLRPRVPRRPPPRFFTFFNS